MIPIQGADYQTASGERRYKGTDPATVVHQDDMNQVLLSLHRIITASGQALLADGAADLSDDWEQLLRAVNRISRKSASIDVPFDEGSTKNIGLTDDGFHYHLTEPSDETDGSAVISTDAANIGRVITIQNRTASRKFVETNGSTIGLPTTIPLYPGQAASFLAVPVGSDCGWTALYNTPDHGTIAVELRGGIDGVIDTGTATYKVENGIVTLVFPAMSGELDSGQDVYISAASGADFPVNIRTQTGMVVPVAIQTNASTLAGYPAIGQAGNSNGREVRFRDADGSLVFDVLFGFYGLTFSYPAG